MRAPVSWAGSQWMIYEFSCTPSPLFHRFIFHAWGLWTFQPDQNYMWLMQVAADERIECSGSGGKRKTTLKLYGLRIASNHKVRWNFTDDRSNKIRKLFSFPFPFPSFLIYFAQQRRQQICRKCDKGRDRERERHTHTYGISLQLWCKLLDDSNNWVHDDWRSASHAVIFYFFFHYFQSLSTSSYRATCIFLCSRPAPAAPAPLSITQTQMKQNSGAGHVSLLWCDVQAFHYQTHASRPYVWYNIHHFFPFSLNGIRLTIFLYFCLWAVNWTWMKCIKMKIAKHFVLLLHINCLNLKWIRASEVSNTKQDIRSREEEIRSTKRYNNGDK